MIFSLLIPDGVGARNFVLGPFLRHAAERGQVHALHSFPDDMLPLYTAGLNGNSNVQWHALSPYRSNTMALLLSDSLANAHMYWADTGAMRYRRNRPIKGSVRKQIGIRAARIVGRMAASPSRILMLDKLHSSAASRMPEVEQYRKLFKETKPAVLFCTHQRPPSIIAPVLAAKSLGIPTATFIFSWDNLTSKGRIAAPFDHYLVWSELMREEMLRYYPDVTPEQVHIVGTPQFDPYADERTLWPRAKFFNMIGADPSRPLICYSGGDVYTCPEDQEHVRVLMELVRAGRIERNPQVIVRPAPVDNGKRFEEVRKLYPELIYAPPAWKHAKPGDWSSTMPTPEDVPFLANLTHYADLNVNVGSTMTLDFALHDKPVVNVAFNVVDPPPHGVPLWEFVDMFDHYRPVLQLGAARSARSPEEFVNHINAYLDDPSLDREARRKFVELEVSYPLGRSSQRIVEVLEQIAR